MAAIAVDTPAFDFELRDVEVFADGLVHLKPAATTDWDTSDRPAAVRVRPARGGGPATGVSGPEGTGWPVGRVLSRATIHLGLPLPTASSGLPAHSGEQPSNVRCLALLRVGFT